MRLSIHHTGNSTQKDQISHAQPLKRLRISQLIVPTPHAHIGERDTAYHNLASSSNKHRVTPRHAPSIRNRELTKQRYATHHHHCSSPCLQIGWRRKGSRKTARETKWTLFSLKTVSDLCHGIVKRLREK